MGKKIFQSYYKYFTLNFALLTMKIMGDIIMLNSGKVNLGNKYPEVTLLDLV
jgi:hypothetical protein